MPDFSTCNTRYMASGGTPVIGEHVNIGAGAKLLGKIVVRDHAKINANAVVLADVPSGAVAVGALERCLSGSRNSASNECIKCSSPSKSVCAALCEGLTPPLRTSPPPREPLHLFNPTTFSLSVGVKLFRRAGPRLSNRNRVSVTPFSNSYLKSPETKL